MKHTKKILALALSAAVVASIAAAGTLAYLTSSGSVVNTFNVGTQGRVSITLDEAPVDGNGAAIDGDRVTENTYENILPNQILDKDPTVHVQPNSTASYVFVYVDNGLGADGVLDINTDAWEAIDTDENGSGTYIYVGEHFVPGQIGVVPATGANETIDLEDVFEHVHINAALDEAGLAALDNQLVTVKAFAIQAENLGGETQTAQEVAYEQAVAFFAEDAVSPIAD